MTAARDREHDEWIPWYLDDTAGWLELSLGARGAASEIARKMGRKSGSIALPRGLSSLAVLLRVRWVDLEPAMAELLGAGRLQWDGATLHDPEWEGRQRSSSTMRMRKKRALVPVSSSASPSDSDPKGGAETLPVTERHMASQGVTGRHAVSPSYSPSSSRSNLSEGVQGETLERTAVFAEDARGVFDALEMNRPTRLDPGTVWLAFCGHFAGTMFPSREALLGKWQKWVTTQGVFAAKDRERDRVRADQEAERKRFAKEGPPRPPEPTREQSARMAAELAARVVAARAAGGGR